MRRSGLGLQMAQGGRWGAVVKQGRGHVKPAAMQKRRAAKAAKGAYRVGWITKEPAMLSTSPAPTAFWLPGKSATLNVGSA